MQITQMPFLYPFLSNSSASLRLATRSANRQILRYSPSSRRNSTVQPTAESSEAPTYNDQSPDLSRLNPAPSDYSRSIFKDRCSVTVHTGSGGNGCVSFLREKYIEEGPANGGDGGTGGSIYIQAVEGQTSLHKLARRSLIKAGRGKNGQGKSKGGQRGEDVLLQVPVGTVVREIWRYDPLDEEEERLRLLKGRGEVEDTEKPSRPNQWVLYPGSKPSEFLRTEFPSLPGPRRSPLASMQPKAPINLDLSEHMERPMILAAGAVGGLGNPHFVSRSVGRPKFATKGETGMKLTLELELKLLADVGLVGLPNAGKSTLLRALTNSRTRVGNWAFTTLSPNIGTVVLDDHKGRPAVVSGTDAARPRDNFTIADIPGLIEGAHLDKGLGLGFLRHIERAKILTFVVDLTAGDAVQALKGLWHEIGQYERLRTSVLNSRTEERLVPWSPFDDDAASKARDEGGDEEHGTESTIVVPSSPSASSRPLGKTLPPLSLPPIYSKPWFVVATKADLPETRENYAALRAYLDSVEKGLVEHPGQRNGWKERLCAVPVSAIKGEGVRKIPEWISGLLDRI
ncbi:GTPase of the mitochondrial inner membrane that associates with the large ribosomal subunit [Arachnomyces sp. PD_36]|nr:GTPase of the mitochondrial inner membrane that associates with the large ribosomal subunit [Arachnomyces sp. PD_36]